MNLRSRRSAALPTLLLVMTLNATSLGAPAPARAGTYVVQACDADSGRNHSWTPYVNVPGVMYAGTLCPTGGSSRRGLVARTFGLGSGRLPYGALAQMRLDAPTRSSVIGYAIRGWAATRQGTGGWRTGIERPGAFHGCGPSASGCSVDFRGAWTTMPSSPWLALTTTCTARAGCGAPNGTPAAQVHAYSASVRIRDDTRPTIGAVGSAWGDGQWHRGTVSLIYSGSDNSGICRVAVTADQGQPLTSTSYSRDDGSVTPCGTTPFGGLTVDTRAAATTVSDGAHVFRLSATDAAGNVSTQQAQVLVDNTAPNRPEALQVTSGTGWQRQDAFHLSWQNPPDQAAPIVAAYVRVCHQPDGICSDPQTVEGAGVDSANVQVPGRGEWTARVWLQDAAGNAYESSSSDPVPLRFDDLPPDLVAFEPSDPTAPQRIRVQVHDQDSGVTSGVIEYSRVGSRVWHELPTHLTGTELDAEINDARLKDGIYQLRAEATDAAGNTTLGERYLDGNPAAVTVPLRARLTLHAGIVEPHRRARLATVRKVGYGRRVVLRGRLTNRDGQPVSGVRIEVFRRLLRTGATRSPLGVARTDGNGHFAYLVRARASQVLRLTYRGSDLLDPAGRTLRLLVSAYSTLRISPRRVLNGDSVTLRGRIIGGRLPPGGKLFALQAFYARGWHSFAGPFHTRPDGRWRAHYRFRSTTGRVVYRFRVFIPREADYPLEAGTSRVRTVTVRGL